MEDARIMSTTAYRSAGRTDPGLVRKNNEDALLLVPEQGLYAVADGMGGVAGGEYASHTTLDIIQRAAGFFEPTNTLEERLAALHNAVDESSRDIRQWAERQGVVGSGTTLVVMALDPRRSDRAVILHAGDSRLYLQRNGHLKAVTKDHSVAESYAGGKDEDVPALFRNVITNAIGLADKVRLEETSISLYRGDVLMICSDGLYRMVSDNQIQEILSRPVSIEDRADALIQAARDGGGKDNITVILLEAEESADLDDGSEAETQDTALHSAREAADFRRNPDHRSTEDSEIMGRSFSDTSTRERMPLSGTISSGATGATMRSKRQDKRWLLIAALGLLLVVLILVLVGGRGKEADPSATSTEPSAAPVTAPVPPPAPAVEAEASSPPVEPARTLWDLYQDALANGTWGLCMERAQGMEEEAVRAELGDGKAAAGRAWFSEWSEARRRPDEAKAELMMMGDDLRRTIGLWSDKVLVPPVGAWSDQPDQAANRYAKVRRLYQDYLFREIESYIGETMLVLAAFGSDLEATEEVLKLRALGYIPPGESLAARRAEVAALAQSLNRWLENNRELPVGVPELRSLTETLLRPMEDGIEALFESLAVYLEAVPGLAINPLQDEAGRTLLQNKDQFVVNVRKGLHETSDGRTAQADLIRSVVSVPAWKSIQQGAL